MRCVRKRCTTTDHKPKRGSLVAMPLWSRPEGSEGPEGTGELQNAGPGHGAGGRWRGLAGVPVGGGRARAGLEIDHSEPQARVWRSRGRAAAHRHTQRPGPSRQATRRSEHQRAGGPPPTGTHSGQDQHGTQREAARPHRDQAAHVSGDSCQKPQLSQHSTSRRRGRPRR